MELVSHVRLGCTGGVVYLCCVSMCMTVSSRARAGSTARATTRCTVVFAEAVQSHGFTLSATAEVTALYHGNGVGISAR